MREVFKASQYVDRGSLTAQINKRMTSRFFVDLWHSVLGKIWYQLEDQSLDLIYEELDEE